MVGAYTQRQKAAAEAQRREVNIIGRKEDRSTLERRGIKKKKKEGDEKNKIKYYHWESTSNQREAVIAHVTSFKVYLPIHPPPECIYYNGVNIKKEKLLRVASRQRGKKNKTNEGTL